MFSGRSHERDGTSALRAKESPDHINPAWLCSSWIAEGAVSGTPAGKPFLQRKLVFAGSRAKRKAKLQPLRDPGAQKSDTGDTVLKGVERSRRGRLVALRRKPNRLGTDGHHSVKTGLTVWTRSITKPVAMAKIGTDGALVRF